MATVMAFHVNLSGVAPKRNLRSQQTFNQLCLPGVHKAIRLHFSFVRG